MSRQPLFVAPSESERMFAKAVAALGGTAWQQVEPTFKDMEWTRFVDRSEWMGWTLDTEVAAIELLRQRSDVDEFDLVGYSGGAAVALAYAVTHPEVLASLTLIEPPWIGNDEWSEEEAAFRAAYDGLSEVPSEDVWGAICGILNASETPIPSKPKANPSDLKDVLLGVWRGYRGAPLDRDRLRRIDSPVYLPVGAGSAPRMHVQAECLASYFPNARVETYEGAHHFDLPFVGAERLANGLNRLWAEPSGR